MAAAEKCKPTIIGMSALLTTTMTYMKTVIDGFEAAGRGPHQDGDRRRAHQPDVRRRNRRRRLRRRTRRPPSICSCGWRSRPDLVATYKILYWQEIPSQIKAEDDSDDVTLPLDPRFMERIDQLAAQPGPASAGRLPRPVAVGRRAGARRHGRRSRRGRQGGARSRKPIGRMSAMAVTLTINGQRPTPAGGRRCSTMPSAWASRFPLPAGSRASARSASSRSPRAWSCCRRPRRKSEHLNKAISACRASACVAGDRATSAATRCAAARCASSGTRSAFPAQARPAARPGRDARRRSHPLIDGEEIDRSDRADPRPRDGPRARRPSCSG